MELTIQVNKQEGVAELLRLEGSRFTLGRTHSSVLLADVNCSRQHAEIYQDESGRIWLRDLASTNGTFLNGTRVLEETELGVGDVLQMGTITVRLKSLRSGITRTGLVLAQDNLTGWPEFVTDAQ